jgi:hypothetical protein
MHDFRECWKGSNLSVSRKSKLNFEVDVVQMEVIQPAAKMLVELSKSQDIVAGDGTTTGQTLHFELQATCAFEVSFEYQWAVLLLCHGLL